MPRDIIAHRIQVGSAVAVRVLRLPRQVVTPTADAAPLAAGTGDMSLCVSLKADGHSFSRAKVERFIGSASIYFRGGSIRNGRIGRCTMGTPSQRNRSAERFGAGGDMTASLTSFSLPLCRG